MLHDESGRRVYLIGHQIVTVDPEGHVFYSSLWCEWHASSSPGPLPVWSDHDYVAERQCGVSGGTESRRTHPVIIRHEDQWAEAAYLCHAANHIRAYRFGQTITRVRRW